MPRISAHGGGAGVVEAAVDEGELAIRSRYPCAASGYATCRMPIDPDFWAGRRVLLTGHTGFKGAWLSLWLQALGAKVIGLAPARRRSRRCTGWRGSRGGWSSSVT